MKTTKTFSLSLPAPCEQHWDDMDRVKGGRHCNTCSKTIIDFSRLTDAEIFAVINSRQQEVCGRFADHQLNRSITAPAPPRHQFMPAMFITAGLAVSIATAGHAATRGLEQIEMGIIPLMEDTSFTGKTQELPEIVVKGFSGGKNGYRTGVVCVIPADIAGTEKPLMAKPILYNTIPVTEKKRKKRFLFF